MDTRLTKRSAAKKADVKTSADRNNSSGNDKAGKNEEKMGPPVSEEIPKTTPRGSGSHRLRNRVLSTVETPYRVTRTMAAQAREGKSLDGASTNNTEEKRKTPIDKQQTD